MSAYFLAAVRTKFSERLLCLSAMGTSVCNFYIYNANKQDNEAKQSNVSFGGDAVIVVK